MIKLEENECLGKKPLISPEIEGMFIAGGAIRKWFSGKEQDTDIDIFFKSKEILDIFIKNNCSNYDLILETNNSLTYKHKEIIIQLIKVKYFNDVKECFSWFDFNCCQFAWDKTGIYTTKEALISVMRNHLSVNKIQQGFELDSLRRAFKYTEKGFKPCNGTLKDLALSFKELTEEQLKNQAEVSPNGGVRTIRFD